MQAANSQANVAVALYLPAASGLSTAMLPGQLVVRCERWERGMQLCAACSAGCASDPFRYDVNKFSEIRDRQPLQQSVVRVRVEPC